MSFYELNGDMQISIYCAVDKKINKELETAVKKAVLEVCQKHGSIEPGDIEVSTIELEYTKEEE